MALALHRRFLSLLLLTVSLTALLTPAAGYYDPLAEDGLQRWTHYSMGGWGYIDHYTWVFVGVDLPWAEDSDNRLCHRLGGRERLDVDSAECWRPRDDTIEMTEPGPSIGGEIVIGVRAGGIAYCVVAIRDGTAESCKYLACHLRTDPCSDDTRRRETLLP